MNTQQLNQALDSIFTIPVVIKNATFPNNQPYQQISHLSQTGFSFTGKELLHAIGCKTASLPSSSRDESISAAYLYTHLLDFQGQYLGYKAAIEIDSDLQTNRSNEIGIGLGCLIASKLFNVDWDTLESIKGQGKRFDYRATAPGQNYAYEFKGTKHRGKQAEQVQNGITKKGEMHARNERYDVELIISAHLNYSNIEPRIILADPPFEGYSGEFTEQANLFYQLRHYSRISQFIGDVALSRALYQQAQFMLNQGNQNINTDRIDELGYRVYQNEIRDDNNQKMLERVKRIDVGRNRVVGRWVSDWVPRLTNSKRKTYSLPKISNRGKLEIFQGVTEDLYNTLKTTETTSIRQLDSQNNKIIEMQNDLEYNTFEDRTVMAYRIV